MHMDNGTLDITQFAQPQALMNDMNMKLCKSCN